MSANRDEFEHRIDQALGRAPADLVLRGGRVLDVAGGGFIDGDVAVSGDTIVGTGAEYRGREEIDARGMTIVPGFVDTHVHVESTLVTPFEFDRCVLPRGTTTAVCDPHEIANVLGLEGIRYFLDSAGETVLDLFAQLSSCVPATGLETSGATLLADDLMPFADHPAVIGLAEMMNFPGLLAKDPIVLDKLAAFSGRHVGGHCPLVRGKDLNAYAACGIRNCHESTSIEEAHEKLTKGMQVLIREGSVSKDLAALVPLLTPRASPFVSFCTDDRNPLDIFEEGHIDHLVRSAIARGAAPLDAYRVASWSGANHFGLTDRGLVAPGYRADLVLIEDLETCAVTRVVKSGRPVDDAAFARAEPIPPVGRGSVRLDAVSAEDCRTPIGGGKASVIGVIPGSILTEHLRLSPDAQDVHPIAVFSRHGKNRNVGRGLVRGMGIQSGALASSVGHDSHNVIVTGTNESDMAVAVNRLIELQGGFVAVSGGQVRAELALPLAGLLSDRPFEEVRDRLIDLRRAVAGMGSRLAEPFLQLAFLPLPVIPHLKITDRGLVDVDRFEVIGL